MSRKRRSKGKQSVFHIEFSRVYHQALMYDELSDIDIETIYQTSLFVLSRFKKHNDICKFPKKEIINKLVEETVSLSLIRENNRIKSCLE